MSSVFHRTSAPMVAVRAGGSWIEDAAGRRYLDAAGGAIVNNVGHGRQEVIAAIASQLELVDYVHAATFSTEAVEEYGAAVAARAPMVDARVYPVSGGSEAAETALKMARAYQLARGRPERTVVLSRAGSYHGNTLGALDLSGRPALRAPYEPWLGRFRQLPLAFDPGLVEAAITTRDDVAAFIAEPVSGAARAAVVPPADYWPGVASICRRHDVLLIADEVMTGFGRTGRWFGVEHWGVEPDLIVAGKGASSGYWPLGLAIASGRVFAAIRESFVHGFTFSHHPAGAAAGLAVLRLLEAEGLIDGAARRGQRLRSELAEKLGERAEVRGKGLLVGVEVAGGASTGSLVAASRAEGLLVYPSALPAAVLLGPPLTVSDDELAEVVARLTRAVDREAKSRRH